MTLKTWGLSTVGALAFATVAAATHGLWHDHYTSASGMPCCSATRDCFIVHARLLVKDWACVIRPEHGIRQDNLRCLFVATGS